MRINLDSPKRRNPTKEECVVFDLNPEEPIPVWLALTDHGITKSRYFISNPGSDVEWAKQRFLKGE